MSNAWDKGLVLSLAGTSLSTTYTYSGADPTQSSPLKYSGQSRHLGLYVRIQKAVMGSALMTITIALESAYQDHPAEYAKVLTLLHQGAGTVQTEQSVAAPSAGSEITALITCSYLPDTISKFLRLGIKVNAAGVLGDFVEVRAVMW